MTTTFRAKADELDERFLDSLKAAFKGQEVEIVVSAMDETEYLSRNPAFREMLLKRMDEVKAGIPLVTPDQSMFQ